MTSAWLDDDEVTTTFRSLKQAQVEAKLAERERIVALLNGDGRFVGARRLLIELIEAADA
jgi:hypothetical protein